MKISDNGLHLIQEFESYMVALPDGRCKAYRCVVGHRDGKPVYDGKWTIGFGVTEGISDGLIWTRAQADEAFRRELATHESAVERLTTVPLNQNMFDSLVSFSFNVGFGALKGSTLLKKLNGGDFDGAARQFAVWVNSNGVKRVPGLVRRRAAEAALFQKLAEAPTEPVMPQTVDVPPAKPEASRTVATANVGQTVAAVGGIAGIGLSLSDSLGYATQILPLAKNYGLQAFIVTMLVLAAGFAIVKHFRQDDHAEGRNLQ